MIIRTGLPYDMSKLDEIRENETVVDMSNLAFPNIEPGQQKRVSFVFLRNTGFDVKLDFENCSYEDKEAFLVLYLTDSVDMKYKELADSYVKILNAFVGNEVDAPCILSDSEVALFIKRNEALVQKAVRLAQSLPVFAMFYFVLNEQAYSTDMFDKSDDQTIKKNFYHIIAADGFVYLYDAPAVEGPVFFTEHFAVDNQELLEAMHKLPFFEILHGLSCLRQDEWEGAIHDADALLHSIENGGAE